MLEKVRFTDYAKGIDVQAYTDGYACDEYASLYLLSAAGHEAQVKAITSALLTGRYIEILSDTPLEVHTRWGGKYKILTSRLPSGLSHQILLSDEFSPSSERRDRLLYIDREEETPTKVYESIKKSCSVPIIPDWSRWLYERLEEEGDLKTLSGTRKVLRLDFDEEYLDHLVSEGVRSGELTF